MIFKGPTGQTLRAFFDLLIRWTEGLNGRIEFGAVADQAAGLNIKGEFLEFTADATPDAEFSVTHDLGYIPSGYIVVRRKLAGSLYSHYGGMTAWTTTTIYFKSDVASLPGTIFVF